MKYQNSKNKKQKNLKLQNSMFKTVSEVYTDKF